jgi:hypothetical protein
MGILDTINARLAIKKQAQVIANSSPLERIAKAIQVDVIKSGAMLVQKDWAAWNKEHGKDSSSTPGYSEERLAKHVEGLHQKNAEYQKQSGGSNAFKTHYTVEHGKKYAKIIATHADMTTGAPNPSSGRSVHSFIDKTNGNVLKANSWKAPHPTPRGNLGDGNYGLSASGVHGANYLRG